jgi:hypothetical protein
MSAVRGKSRKLLKLLCTFSTGHSIGENALLSGPYSRRVVTLRAETDVEYLIADRKAWTGFINQYPHAIVGFILTTTCRQWRVAYITLVDILGVCVCLLVCACPRPAGCAALMVCLLWSSSPRKSCALASHPCSSTRPRVWWWWCGPVGMPGAWQLSSGHSEAAFTSMDATEQQLLRSVCSGIVQKARVQLIVSGSASVPVFVRVRTVVVGV